MAFWRKISLSRAVSARVQIQRGVWKQGWKDRSRLQKHGYLELGVLKTVVHRRRCGVDTKLLDKALVVKPQLPKGHWMGMEK